MQVKTAYGLNVKNMTFNGLVDYGSSMTAEDIRNAKDRKKTKKTYESNIPSGSNEMKDNLADHALVFMLFSLTASFHQPIGVFATKGAAPCSIMTKLLITAIISV